MTVVNAKFNVGQLVVHKLFNYRGVIIDVDPRFMGDDEWYEHVARSRPPKDKPWYHVLVDNAQHQTYVAERNLDNDMCDQPITHPLIDAHFPVFKDGQYMIKQQRH